ncbi:MAG TPA: STAS domain-containing protein [Candidatus Nanopelagicales bacterium]
MTAATEITGVHQACRWTGAVTWRETAGLREDLLDQLEAGVSGALWLDVREVSIIDRCGIALLIGAQHRAQAMTRGLVLIDAIGPVTSTMARLHLLDQFHVEQVQLPQRRERLSLTPTLV